MNRQDILESLTRALESWVRNASAEQLWRVHRSGGLGAFIEADEEIVRVRIALDGSHGALSVLGKTEGRLPVTEAFLGMHGVGWGMPPAQGSHERERWFMSSELAQAHARQWLVAEVGQRRDLLTRCVDEWSEWNKGTGNAQ
ncbi:hypothetical protein VLK31_01425 [Variovorax sp. H27-G14]|uniref:hypothetical protein n=1 Tax=Variovorax sp. H27-G14 TaxID=3111914 RepID=UPI0038FC1900